MRNPNVPDYGMTKAEYDNYVEEHGHTPTQDPISKSGHSMRRPKIRPSVDGGQALERANRSLHAEAIPEIVSIEAISTLLGKELDI